MVENTNDSGTGSLRAEVAAAQSGDTIVFSHKVYGRTITLTSGPIVDTGTSLTIHGPGAARLTVSGDDQSGIFNLVPSDPSHPPFAVSITGLTLADAAGPDSSPSEAINDTNASLTLGQDVIADNQNGGVEVVSGYTSSFPPPPTVSVTITRSAFLDNQCDFPGGGLFVSGVVLSVGSSLFEGNSVPTNSGALGGAIYISGTPATDSAGGVSSTIDGSRFIGNSALWFGGAIENDGEALTISDTSFIGNQAKFGGGALENNWSGPGFGGDPTGALSIQGSTFMNNQAIGFNSDSVFGTTASGGAIDLSNLREAVSISGSTFIGDLAQGGDGGSGVGGSGSGGAISETFSDPELVKPTTFAVNGCTFIGNQAVGGRGDSGGGLAQGGAVSVTSFASSTIAGSDFRRNGAVGGSGGAGETIPFPDKMDLAAFGGAIQMASVGPATISGDLFDGNTAQGGEGGPGLSGGTAEGGAINGYYATMTLSDLHFVGNQASGGGGGDAAPGSSASGGPGGQAAGGAFAYFDFYGDLVGGLAATITDVHSSGDQAIGGAGGSGDGAGAGGTGGDALGGGIWNGGFLTLSSGQFSGDRATGGTGGPGGVGGAGGDGGNGWGGALASGVSGIPDDALSLSVADSRFSGNRADGGEGGFGTTEGAAGEGNGGAIAILAGPATIARSKFAGNKASTSGDDIYGTYAP
jgi:predicted outer membrane repeat protein